MKSLNRSTFLEERGANRRRSGECDVWGDGTTGDHWNSLIQLSQLSGTMHSRTRPTRPWRDFCADHPTDAIPPWKRQYDTISPCGAQGWKRAILLKMWGGYFSSFLGLPGFRFAGMSAEGFRPSAASISSSFGLTLTSRQPPSSPTRTFFARFKSDMMRE